jgi:hypothetical protein
MIKEIDGLKTLYKKLLEVDANGFKDDIYTFFPQAGEKYFNAKKRCLFIGKSVNGWVTKCTDVDALFNIKNKDRIVNRNDQMEWVSNLEGQNGKKYNTKKSAFWRIIKNISLEYFGEKDWYNYIAWSNLYKPQRCIKM